MIDSKTGAAAALALGGGWVLYQASKGRSIGRTNAFALGLAMVAAAVYVAEQPSVRQMQSFERGPTLGGFGR